MRTIVVLLAVLMLMSAGLAYAVSASDALKGLALGVFGAHEIVIDADLMLTSLSPDQRAKAVEIALGYPPVQEMLEDVDDYSTSVADVYELQAIDGGDHGTSIALLSKERVALVDIRLIKDYRGVFRDEFGVKAVKVTVDLLEEQVMEIEEGTEVHTSNVHESVLALDELLGHPSVYHGQVVRVSGVMSDLGLLRCPCFTLDGNRALLIWYLYDETNIYPTQIQDKVQNGDPIVVTGRFFYEPQNVETYRMYAEKVEKI
ncbi:hypothetical protein AC480_04960 [miscellaneous Crenarchaeota group archaeon SMTZ1-55]|jgi:hypothetical protein|nr:MAG: hypothetical protein AC480_04960 [miscellaneous Crenarchaeota group archaeon SMTZ1-55]